MRPYRAMFVALVLCAAVACEDDPATPDHDLPAYGNLTQRSHVLANLELAYEYRDLDAYSHILDGDFGFFLYPGDVDSMMLCCWNRSQEIAIHANMFDPGYDGAAPACEGINLDILDDHAVWLAMPYGDETWYVATIFYNFQFDMEGDVHLISLPGAKAQFTVRNAGTDEDPVWQLVRIFDLYEGEMVVSSSSATESSSWGKVKAMYR